MRKKTIVILSCLLALCLSSFSALAYTYQQQRLSNEINAYTYLQAPIRLTKIGDLPAQIVTGETYIMKIFCENIANKAYTGSIVIQISASWYYPVTPMPGNITIINPDNNACYSSGQAPSANGGVTMPPYPYYYPYEQLSPDMVTVTLNNVTLELAFNQTTNALIGQTSPFNIPVGFSKTYNLAITFNDSAYTDTGYYLTAWVDQA